ncbi:MAG: hypothetical protein ACK4N5_14805, partial [Myxococcales bacterium]
EVNDLYIKHFGQPLIPADTTVANVIAHQLIGEAFANQLDEAVHLAVDEMLNEESFALESVEVYRETLKSPNTEAAWKRPQPFAIGPKWAHEYGLEVYGLAFQVPPPLDVRERLKALRAQGVEDLVPVAGILGSRTQLAFDARGNYFWVEDGARAPARGSFLEIVTDRLKLLVEDKEKARAAGDALWK